MRPAGLIALSLACCSPAAAETGIASVYVDWRVACPGERYNPLAMIAAHKTLPCGTLAEVVNLRNGWRLVVRIVDRGPYVRGRIVDLTPAAAWALGIDGLGPVRMAPYLAPASPGLAVRTFEGEWRLRSYPTR